MAAFAAQAAQLRGFVEMCKADPGLLHRPELGFYREYLESLGATLPPPPPKKEEKAAPPPPKKEEEPAAPEEEEEAEESEPELDEAGVIQDKGGEELASGEIGAEVTEEAAEAAGEKRSAALAAMSEGNKDEALSLFTEALQLNPNSALLYAKRAKLLIDMERPLAAVRDCDKALQLNPDSATAYKFRGRAFRLLGEWERAFKDLSTACRLDYDDLANDWLKEVEPNAKKIAEHKRKTERKREEKALKERQERVRKAKEEYEKQKAAAPEDDGPEMPDMGGMGGMGGLFNDPELMTAFQDPEVAAAFADISQNPANIAKWSSNPKVAKVMEKMASKMGGAGGGMPGMGGMFGGMGAGGPPPPTSAPTSGATSGPTPNPTPAGPPPDLDID